MSLYIRDKDIRGYEQAIINAVWRSEVSRQNGWRVESISPLLIQPGVSQQVLKLHNPNLGYANAAFLVWTRFLSEGFKNMDCYHFKLVQGAVTGSKQGMVAERDKEGKKKLAPDGNPIMVPGRVSITDAEFVQRFQMLRTRLSKFIPCLEDALGEPVECSFKPKEPVRVYSSAKPKQYGKIVPVLKQGYLFNQRGEGKSAVFRPLFNFPVDRELKLT